MKTSKRRGMRGRVLNVCALTCCAGMLLGASRAHAASWSAPSTISGVLPSSTNLAFAADQNDNQVWLTEVAVSGGHVVQAASRPAGGSFGPPVTLSSVFANLTNLTAAVSSNGTAAAAWSTNSGVQLSLRSASGAWSAPASLTSTGSSLDLQVKLDAQGNGVVVWTELTSTVAVVEAVTWASGGRFGTPVQLSSSSHGAFLPDLALNDQGTAVVVWQAASSLDNSNPYQVESAQRPANGAWSTPVAVSPVQQQTWNPQVAVDAAGDAAAVWEQGATAGNYRIYAGTRAAGTSWSVPTQLDVGASWAGGTDIASDAAGDFTAAWLIAGTSGNEVHSATRRAGASFSAPSVLGSCSSSDILLCSTPEVAASADGSLTVVGWAAYGSANAPNVATRVGFGGWTHTVLSAGNASTVFTLAANHAQASAFWPQSTTGRHKIVVEESDYR